MLTYLVVESLCSILLTTQATSFDVCLKQSTASVVIALCQIATLISTYGTNHVLNFDNLTHSCVFLSPLLLLSVWEGVCSVTVGVVCTHPFMCRFHDLYIVTPREQISQYHHHKWPVVVAPLNGQAYQKPFMH